MTTYYVGSTSAGSEDGSSWANRFGTLADAEAVVAAGDLVWVGPGVYREQLSCTTSGSSGNPITYVGDVTGEHTDGVGGTVRITGSDDDQTTTRDSCITATSINFRTFRGFTLDLSGNYTVYGYDVSDWIIEDCSIETLTTCLLFETYEGSPNMGNLTIRRCVMWAHFTATCIYFGADPAVNDANIAVENCTLFGGYGVDNDMVGGVAVRNCTILLAKKGVSLSTQPNEGQAMTVQNCIITRCEQGVAQAADGTCLTEDYNAFGACGSNRVNVDTGAHSIDAPPLFAAPLLHAGQVLPSLPFGTLSEWSTVKRIAGSGESSDDLFGRTRPTTSAKNSWGAIQYQGIARATATSYNSSPASLKLADAGEAQFRVPVTAESTTIACKVYREGDYSGTSPRMVISQPGQSDRTTTDAGSASAWNTLTDTFTPAASPPYVLVKLQSLNSATSGNYAVYFDALSVS